MDGTTGTSRCRAAATKSSVASTEASGSTSIVSTPVARNHNGETWCSVSARASMIGCESSSVQYGKARRGRSGRPGAAGPSSPPTTRVGDGGGGDQRHRDGDEPRAQAPHAVRAGRRRRAGGASSSTSMMGGGVAATIAPRCCGRHVAQRRHEVAVGGRLDVDEVGHGDHDAPGRGGRGDARRRVLDGHALLGVDAEGGRRLLVGLGMRFAVDHRVTGHDGVEADRRQLAQHGVDEAGATTS